MLQELTGIEMHTDGFLCDECIDKLTECCNFKRKIAKNFETIFNVKLLQNQEVEDVEACVKQNPSEPEDQEIEEEYYEEEYDPDTTILDESSYLQDSQIQEPEQTEQDISNLAGGQLILEDFIGIGEPAIKDESTEKDSISLNPMTGKMEKVLKRKVEGIEAETRKSYTAQNKLEMVRMAEQKGNAVCAKFFNVNESCIRLWRKQKTALENMDLTRKTRRRGTPYWPQLEDELKEWVFKERGCGHDVNSFDIKMRALEIAKRRNLNNFSGTKMWCFSFMKRSGILALRNRKNHEKHQPVKQEI
jgi:transposase-like protein